MTCQDCGLELTEDYGSPLLAREMEQIAAAGQCIACAFRQLLVERIRELKGEVECQTKN